MAYDPTKGNRAALATLVPKSTPLGQSLAKSKKEEEDQLAADEANNLVMQRDPVALPEEAQNFTNPQIAAAPASADEKFVTPGQAPQEAQRAPGAVNSAPMGAPSQGSGYGFMTEANAIGEQGRQEGQVYNDLNSKTAELDQQINDRTKEQAAIKQFEADDAKTREQLENFKIEPHTFFSGKPTWEKIVGGIGMFLGSITPQGAQNVAGIINKEIDRDIQNQKNNYALLKDKSAASTSRYKMKLEQYKDEKLAMLSMKKDMYSAAELQLKRIASISKSGIARGKAEQGISAIQMQKDKLSMEWQTQLAKATKEASKGTVPGFSGTVTDAKAARDFRGMLAESEGVKSEINNLKTINKQFLGGSLSPSARASAQSSQSMLIGKLRVAIAGPGTMSDGDRKLLNEAIANPTDFFSLGSSNEIKLNQLSKAYQNSLDANAKALGLTKQMPQGARKVE